MTIFGHLTYLPSDNRYALAQENKRIDDIQCIVSSEIYQPELSTVSANDKVRVYFPESQTVKVMNIDDYLCGVLVAEMYMNAGEEALKSMAVAARSYTLYMCNENKNKEYDVSADHTISQAYISKDDAVKIWAERGKEKYEVMEKAVKETSGQVLVYCGKIICAMYHASSYQCTENSGNVFLTDLPYLSAVNSTEDINNVYKSTVEYSVEEVKSLLAKKGYAISSINNCILENVKSDSGRCCYFLLKNKDECITIDGKKIRDIFSLKSTSFDIEPSDGKIVFYVYGFGHGVGLSQNGADILSKQGYGYEEILKHYYSGTTLAKINQNNE